MEPEPAHIDHEQVVQVEIAALTAAGSPRTSGEDPEHVEALAGAQVPLPPIIVHQPSMRVIDGLHRLRAAQLRGHTTIEAVFFDGEERDAFVLAVEANTTHGLPLSMADRKRAAGRIFTTHPDWSDRMVASVVGVAPGTVAEVRRQIRDGAAPDAARTGQDGRVRPINAAEGRSRAGRIIAADPSLSLRQIARAAGISPETARDVRNRLMRGEDPVLQPRGERHRGSPAVPALRHAFGPGVTTRGRAAARDRVTVIERLRTDPALRFSSSGRTLLRLLTLHTLSPENWDKIIEDVPSHCSGLVAELAGECAGLWAEFADRVERKVANVAEVV
ncbi:ParB N-terminal domain-containing protein [Spirillospora sp. NPDC052269]